MKSLLVHLAGSLSAELGSELYLKIKEESSSPCLFCLDFTEMTEISEVGVEYLNKIRTRCKETGSRLAGFGISDELTWALDNICTSYETKEDAIVYLESYIVDDAPANELVPKQENGNSRYIECPSCSQKLRWKRSGDHLCPNCHTKFFVDIKGWVEVYERLL